MDARDELEAQFISLLFLSLLPRLYAFVSVQICFVRFPLRGHVGKVMFRARCAISSSGQQCTYDDVVDVMRACDSVDRYSIVVDDDDEEELEDETTKRL